MVVLIGTFGSAYSQWASGAPGSGRRAFGVFLIGAGTLTVATGGSLTRFGHHWLYGPMVLGLVIIFAGYRRVTRPTATAPAPLANLASESAPGVARPDATIGTDDARRDAWPSRSGT